MTPPPIETTTKIRLVEPTAAGLERAPVPPPPTEKFESHLMRARSQGADRSTATDAQPPKATEDIRPATESKTSDDTDDKDSGGDVQARDEPTAKESTGVNEEKKDIPEDQQPEDVVEIAAEAPELLGAPEELPHKLAVDETGRTENNLPAETVVVDEATQGDRQPELDPATKSNPQPKPAQPEERVQASEPETAANDADQRTARAISGDAPETHGKEPPAEKTLAIKEPNQATTSGESTDRSGGTAGSDAEGDIPRRPHQSSSTGETAPGNAEQNAQQQVSRETNQQAQAPQVKAPERPVQKPSIASDQQPKETPDAAIEGTQLRPSKNKKEDADRPRRTGHAGRLDVQSADTGQAVRPTTTAPAAAGIVLNPGSAQTSRTAQVAEVSEKGGVGDFIEPAAKTDRPEPGVEQKPGVEFQGRQSPVRNPGAVSPTQRPVDDASQAVDHVRFVQRVVRALQAASQRGGEVRLRLSPPELGSLKLEVTVERGVLSARIEAETAHARTILLDNMPALRDRLAEQQIKIAHFDVDLMQEPPDSPRDHANANGDRDEHRGAKREQMQSTVQIERPAAMARLLVGDGELDVVI